VSNDEIRVHVVMPKAVIDELDELVGARRRRGFLAEAARQTLECQRRAQTLERFAGWLKDADIPGWETPEATAEWVRRQRRIG
jgi:hypothetical protein